MQLIWLCLQVFCVLGRINCYFSTIVELMLTES